MWPHVPQGHRRTVWLDLGPMLRMNQHVALAVDLPDRAEPLRSVREPLQHKHAEGIEVFWKIEEFTKPPLYL